MKESWTDKNAYQPISVTGSLVDGMFLVLYDDEAVESLNLGEQQWRFAATGNANIGDFSTPTSCKEEVLIKLLINFAKCCFKGSKLQSLGHFHGHSKSVWRRVIH